MIPVNEPVIGKREIEYVNECLSTGWISSSGRFIGEFEKRWAAYCGRRHGVAVSNGTAALELALECLDLSPGDEIILPSFTIISCALAVLQAGATPVLVDCDPDTYTMDPGGVEARIGPRTRAIMPVAIYGHPPDLDPILRLADKHGIAVVEDAAEAHGGEYRTGLGPDSPAWKRCGSFGRMSCFSFYANKLVTTGEGGMVVTDDDGIAERARSIRNLCFGTERRFHHEGLGHNFRMTNIQAAIGLGQLERMEEIVSQKRHMGEAYTRGLKGIPALKLPAEASWARSVYWMYAVVLSEASGMDAEAFAGRLREKGVETRPFFLGMHEQPVFRRKGLFSNDSFPVTERIARQGLYLPSGLALTESQIDRVCDAVREVLS